MVPDSEGCLGRVAAALVSGQDNPAGLGLGEVVGLVDADVADEGTGCLLLHGEGAEAAQRPAPSVGRKQEPSALMVDRPSAGCRGHASEERGNVRPVRQPEGPERHPLGAEQGRRQLVVPALDMPRIAHVSLSTLVAVAVAYDPRAVAARWIQLQPWTAPSRP